MADRVTGPVFKVRVTKRPTGKARFWFKPGDLVVASMPGGVLGGTVFLHDARGEMWAVKSTCWIKVEPV